MKLFLIFTLSVFPVLVNAQKKDKLYIGLQVQPELSFHKSHYPTVYPPDYSKSSFNIGFNLYGQYQLTNHLYTTLGVGFISRKLNTSIGIDESMLPAPYTDPYATGAYQTTKVVSYRLLQIPVGFGYSFLKTKKTNIFASIAFIPNFLFNTKYGGRIQYPSPGAGDPYPAFKKNYWQGFSLNPTVGLDYALSGKIKLTSTLAYSIVNTVREEECASKQPKLKHTYLQLGLGAKYKLK